MKKNIRYLNLPWCIGLMVIALAVFIYIFNPKLDLNGDNCYYYINATSLAAGNGYSNMFGEPTNNFPPGYPLLMTPLRIITDSIVAQKIQNLFLLFIGVLLLFDTLVKVGFKRSLSFVACVAVLLTPHLLEFSTMMMSEAACFCCIALIFRLYLSLPADDRALWRSPCFYFFLSALIFVYYIRTQAVVVAGAFVLALLFARRWRVAIAVACAFVAGCLPWMIRNAVHGLEQSRYLTQVDFSKILSTLKMLLVQAVPESIVPFVNVNYIEPPTITLWAFALLWLLFIIVGFCEMRRLRWPLLLFFAGTLAIVSIINTPSLYRYIIIALPFLTAALFVGIWSVGEASLMWLSKGRLGLSPWILSLLLVPLFVQTNENTKHTIYGLHNIAAMQFPAQFDNFIEAGRSLYRRDKFAIVATRKPEILFVGSGVRGRHFLETDDDRELVADLLMKGVDFVLLDQLGTPATIKYMYPCVKRHPEFFRPVIRVPNPDTYLIYFDRIRARKWLDE
ncbi:MAG: hypothetical protein IJF00_00820 [Bacteroidaceae bacterium]|nr:hypothetical protein [Bacteroidaceae bacterium]